jgi:hypothetical protein
MALLVRLLAIAGLVGLAVSLNFQETHVTDTSGQHLLDRYAVGLPDSWIVWERTPTTVSFHSEWGRWSFAIFVGSILALIYAIRLSLPRKQEKTPVEAGK